METNEKTNTAAPYLKIGDGSMELFIDSEISPFSHPCPNCGYCPHCGRGGREFSYPPHPIYPIPWYCHYSAY